MTDDQRKTVALYLNRVPFVRWDRFGESPHAGGAGKVHVFGWIHRVRDLRSDFVVVVFQWSHTDHPDAYVEYTTSSAEHSEKIAELLYGVPPLPGEHQPCQRVEHGFRDLVKNVVVLGG